MSSPAPLSCAVCSVKLEDLDALLQHMAGHSAAASAPPLPLPVPSAATGNARQIVLSQTAFLRLQPLLQQNTSKSMVIVTAPTQVARARKARSLVPRRSQEMVNMMDVEVLDPLEPLDVDEIRCKVCQRSFKHKYSLVAHCRQHIMSRLCGVCHLRLPDGQALVLHLESHMEKNSSFKCDQCDKSFVHAKSLYVHKRNHSGVRPYTCQYCLKTFRHWHKHRVHVRIHTGERPYRCEVCGWGFPRNDERKRHMRTHVGKKAFHCLDCGIGCGTQAALMNHVDIHHRSVPATEEPETSEATDQNANTTDTTTGTDQDNPLCEEITVKAEPHVLAADSPAANDEDDEAGDPTYRTEDSETSDDDIDLAPSQHRPFLFDKDTLPQSPAPAEAAGTDEATNTQEDAGRMDCEAVSIKTEPHDPDDVTEGGQWGTEDGELDSASARLLEPEVNLTEMFIDVERMRATIRRKITANADKFDDSITKKAKLYVKDPEPTLEHMKSILQAKLEEGKHIQAMLKQNESDKHDTESKPPSLSEHDPLHEKAAIKPEPVDPEDCPDPLEISAVGEERSLPENGTEREAGVRISDPSATPRVPRRRWIQHSLDFSRTEATVLPSDSDTVRMSTGFGEL